MKILGILFVVMAIVVIICFEVLSVEMVKRDARKEEHKNARREIKWRSEKRYREMLENTEYRVRQRVVFTNETRDIKW
jgi:predicted membrane protein